MLADPPNHPKFRVTSFLLGKHQTWTDLERQVIFKWQDPKAKYQGIRNKEEREVGLRRLFTSSILCQASLLRLTASCIKFSGEKWNKPNRKLSYNETK